MCGQQLGSYPISISPRPQSNNFSRCYCPFKNQNINRQTNFRNLNKRQSFSATILLTFFNFLMTISCKKYWSNPVNYSNYFGYLWIRIRNTVLLLPVQWRDPQSFCADPDPSRLLIPWPNGYLFLAGDPPGCGCLDGGHSTRLCSQENCRRRIQEKTWQETLCADS